MTAKLVYRSYTFTMSTPQPKQSAKQQVETKVFTGIQPPNIRVLKPHALDLKNLLQRLYKTK
jgi:hypothetical protein